MRLGRRAPEADDGDRDGEPVTKRLVRAWLAAKLLPIAVRLATWAAWLGAVLAYAAFVTWKVRRLAKRGALDEPMPVGPPTPVSARERGVLAWIRGDETFTATRRGSTTPPERGGAAVGVASRRA